MEEVTHKLPQKMKRSWLGSGRGRGWDKGREEESISVRMNSCEVGGVGKIIQNATCSNQVRAISHSPEMQLRILNFTLSAKGRKKVA